MLLVGLLGMGLAFFVILTVGILLGIISLGGLQNTIFGFGFSGLGLFSAAFWLMVNYGSKLLVASLIGSWLFRLLSKNYAGHVFWPLLAGVITYVILRSIPLLGFLFGILATLMGLGAAWLALHAWRRPAAPAVALAEPMP